MSIESVILAFLAWGRWFGIIGLSKNPSRESYRGYMQRATNEIEIHSMGCCICCSLQMQIWDSIDLVGVEPDLFKDATCFEEDDDRLNEIKFMKLTAQDDMLAPCKGKLEASSVACAHFNQALYAAECGMPNNNKNLCLDGKLNVAVIKQAHPLLAPVFDGGLKWITWRKGVEALYPSLPDIAQRALNAKHSTQQGQDHFQMYGRACMLLNNKEFASGCTNDRMMSVARDIKKSAPYMDGGVITSIVEAARKFGGDGTFKLDILQAKGVFKPIGRTVKSDTWKAIADLKFPVDELPPNVITAVIITLAVASVPNAIAAGDVRSLPKKAKDVKTIESIIKEAFVLCCQMKAPNKVSLKAMTDLRITLVLKLCNRLPKDSKYISMEYMAIAKEFYNKMNAHAECDAQVQCPWVVTTHDDDDVVMVEPKPNRSVSIAQHVIQYDEQGNATGLQRMMLADKGFVVDGYAKNNKTGEMKHKQNDIEVNRSMCFSS